MRFSQRSGNVGSLDLGSTTLSAGTVAQHGDALERIGAALAEDGYILLYGCNVAEGEAGAEFIGRLAQVTGADVAASTDATRAADRGGNWVLEAASGAVQAQAVPGFAGLLGNFDVTGLDPVTNYQEGSGPVIIDNNVIITDDTNREFGGGYVDFFITGATADEKLGIQEVASLAAVSTANGAVSVFDGSVYLGTGSESTVIGSVDAVKNGVVFGCEPHGGAAGQFLQRLRQRQLRVEHGGGDHRGGLDAGADEPVDPAQWRGHHCRPAYSGGFHLSRQQFQQGPWRQRFPSKQGFQWNGADRQQQQQGRCAQYG